MAPQRRIDRVLDPAYRAEVDSCSLDELRQRHAELLEIETEVSYVRRLAQGRLDILRAEIDRRAAGRPVSDLIADLPAILADDGPSAGVAASNLPRLLAPSMSIEWNRGLEPLVSDATLANLPTLSDGELREAIGRLEELEREVSATRRQLHGILDAVKGALGEQFRVDPAESR